VSTLTGTGKLVRLILRRDRSLIPAWVLWMGLIPIGLVSTYDKQYATVASRLAYAKTSGSNPVYLALYGPLPNADLSGIVAQRVGAVPVFVALCSLLTVIRHTRTEEQTGRRELLGSTVVGRHAALAAALIVTMTADLVLGLIMGAGMSRQLPASGSWALALGFVAAGWMFAAIGGVAAQLTEDAGTARGLSIGALGAAILLAVAGDLNGEGGTLSWLTWLSPLGWIRRLHPFAGERWWIFALAFAFTVVAAVRLSARRDVGAGILPARLGPATGSRGLSGSLGLAWRLHRMLLLGWIAGFVVLGVVFGGIAEGFGDLIKDSQNLQDVFARLGAQKDLIDSFLAATMGLFGLIVSAYGIQATLRLRAEEAGARAEYLLAGPASRARWIASHLVFSLLGPAAALAAAGVSMGIAHGANTGDIGGEVPRVLAGAMLQLPAVWVLTGVAIALFGLLPRVAAAVSWTVLAVLFTLTLFGQGLGLNQHVLDISPFVHIPRIPGGHFSAMPLIWLLAIAVLLGAVGMTGARRRDLGAA
jgi:putative exporter of polyketide antibiotics